RSGEELVDQLLDARAPDQLHEGDGQAESGLEAIGHVDRHQRVESELAERLTRVDELRKSELARDALANEGDHARPAVCGRSRSDAGRSRGSRGRGRRSETLIEGHGATEMAQEHGPIDVGHRGLGAASCEQAREGPEAGAWGEVAAAARLAQP